MNQCKRYGVSFLACPAVIFLVISSIIMASMIGTYLIASHLVEEPEVSALIVLFVTFVLVILNYLITQSFTRLAEANQLKSEFISIVSHQMRTPLSAFKWAIELLTKSDLDSIKRNEYLEIIKETNNKLIRLVNNLLDIDRIESNRIVIERQPISLAEIILEAIGSLKILTKNNNIFIDFNPPADEFPLILADISKTKIIIYNLIDNAVKYTLPGKHVIIGMEKINGYLKVNIKDDGVGIAKENQKQIFQKFFRSQNGMTNQIAGSGLGLYVAKAFIEAQKGRIGFTSQENKGSTFWFTLPI